MLRCMDSAVAGLRAHQNKMDVVGHNIANVNTFGFKSQTYTFKEAMYQTSTTSTGNGGTQGSAGGVNAAQFGYGSLMGTIGMNMGESTPTYFGGFNAHISGDGFFLTKNTSVANGVSSDSFVADGNFMYTRVGKFTTDSAGFIVDGNGNYVYGFRATDPATGAVDTATLVALRAPQKTSYTTPSYSTNPGDDAIKLDTVQIDSAGKISAVISNPDDPTESKTIYIGCVAIASFQNPNGLNKAGESYYTATEGDNTGEAAATQPGIGSTPTLMTGYLEGSNVDLAQEFSEMITTHRGFQANSKMITVADEMLSDLVSMKR